jgi:hypothetical protein
MPLCTTTISDVYITYRCLERQSMIVSKILV